MQGPINIINITSINVHF